MVRIHFVFSGEGPADEPLVDHLVRLCTKLGAQEVTGVAADLRRTREPVGHKVVDRLRAMIALERDANLLLVHRDADSDDPTSRYDEIRQGAATLELSQRCVAVVPVYETETWLLLDESAIREVAGNRDGRVKLNLPTPAQAERLPNTKEVLQEALIRASQLSGRSLAKFRRNFAEQRRALLQQLRIDGPIQQLRAWQRLRTDLERFMSSLK